MDFKTKSTRLIAGERPFTKKSVASLSEIARDHQFSRWFEGSAIVDERGMPLVLYHGGLKFDAFRGSPDALAHYTSDDYATAHGYATQYGERNRELKALFLRIVNPLDLRDPRVFEKWVGLEPESCGAYSSWGEKAFMAQAAQPLRSGGSLIEKVRAAGHDGFIFYDTDVYNKPLHTSYAFFEPNQAKLAPGEDATLNYYEVRAFNPLSEFSLVDDRLDR